MDILQLLQHPAQELFWILKLVFGIYLFALAALFAVCLSSKLMIYWTISQKLEQARKKQ